MPETCFLRNKRIKDDQRGVFVLISETEKRRNGETEHIPFLGFTWLPALKRIRFRIVVTFQPIYNPEQQKQIGTATKLPKASHGL